MTDFLILRFIAVFIELSRSLASSSLSLLHSSTQISSFVGSSVFRLLSSREVRRSLLQEELVALSSLLTLILLLLATTVTTGSDTLLASSNAATLTSLLSFLLSEDTLLLSEEPTLSVGDNLRSSSPPSSFKRVLDFSLDSGVSYGLYIVCPRL